MNDPLAQLQRSQQQIEAMQAQAQQTLLWVCIGYVLLGIICSVVTFFVYRWFLLHVFAIQQKRFFTELDLFLHQRGLAPHIPNPLPITSKPPTGTAQPAAGSSKNLTAAALARFTAPTPSHPAAPVSTKPPLPTAWEELNRPVPEPPAEDSRYMPKT